MESYQVLMNWEGKMEPSSPSSPLSQATTEDYYVMDDDFANELFGDVLFDVEPEEEKPSAIELLKELAEEINITIDEDQWLGVKPKLPHLEDYVPIPAGPIAVQQHSAKLENTEDLLMEFDYICELTALTPPQTPPQQYQHHNLQQHEIEFLDFYQQQQQQQQQEEQQQPPLIQEQQQLIQSNPIPSWNEENFTYTHSLNEELPSDIRRELEVVDELVRSRSKDLLPNNWTEIESVVDDDDENSCSASSETGSTVSSSSPRSDSSYCGSAYSQDQEDDWSPSDSSSPKKKSSSVAAGSRNALSGVTKKRTRAYGRAPEDKKVRKKEQNKNAATRYRQKKKAEIEEILVEERKLMDQNEDLQTKSNDVKREVRYLKSLMRDLYKAKGVL